MGMSQQTEIPVRVQAGNLWGSEMGLLTRVAASEGLLQLIALHAGHLGRLCHILGQPSQDLHIHVYHLKAGGERAIEDLKRPQYLIQENLKQQHYGRLGRRRVALKGDTASESTMRSQHLPKP